MDDFKARLDKIASEIELDDNFSVVVDRGQGCSRWKVLFPDLLREKRRDHTRIN